MKHVAVMVLAIFEINTGKLVECYKALLDENEELRGKNRYLADEVLTYQQKSKTCKWN